MSGREAEERGAAERDAIVARYARRDAGDRYSLLNPDVWQATQERQRALLQLFRALGWHDLGQRRLVEVGCGEGVNLLELLRMGFAPEHLAGIELVPARAAGARRVLPEAVAVHVGEASAIDLEPESQDVVYAATVFSSILDLAFQQRLAAAMWRWVRPGGGVLWYDFTVDNPRNADVRGVPRARLAALFPEGEVRARRLTLAPPLARAVTRVHPALYTALNCVPALRTHLLAWIAKRGPGRNAAAVART
jgi:SAM-dependent methyltransferase